MANIKKFNPDTQSWETWASNSASGVYSVNPTLLPEEEQAITVEDALVRDREDIELMKKNISWLALHGGSGGSGGGGGGEPDVTSSIEILDQNLNPTKTIIWKENSRSVHYQINSSKASNLFKVSATLDGRVIYTESDVPQGKTRQINITRINANSTNTSHTLRVSAVDTWDNVIYTDAVINETSVRLSTNSDIYNVNINELTAGSTLSLSYQSSIIGDYVLYWGTSSDIDVNQDHRLGWMQIPIRSSFSSSAVIPYWAEKREDRLLESLDVYSGQTLTFYFILVSVSDSSIKSNVLEIPTTVISPNIPAIQPTSLSSSITEMSKISKASIMSCNFIVFLDTKISITYYYNITANKIELDENTGEWVVVDSKPIVENGSGRYGVVTTVPYNALPKDDFFQGGCQYRFDYYVQDQYDPTKNNTAYAYLDLQSAADKTIPLGEITEHKRIFEFNVWGDSGLDEQNLVWNDENSEFYHTSGVKNVETQMSFVNMGGKSKVEATHCRLTNKAYSVINGSKIAGENISWFPTEPNSPLTGLVDASAPQFTLSVAYYNDFTPDDNRTVLNFGDYVPATTTTQAYGEGILINNHDFYVQLGPDSPLITGKIQDSIYHQIDIVVGRGNDSNNENVLVEVYHNGVLLAVDTRSRAADLFGLSSFNEMSIACNKQRGRLSQFTNIKLKSVALYGIALSPYEIVCKWINSLVTYELQGNELNTALLNEKLEQNLITPYEENGETKYKCALWDVNGTNTYNTSEWSMYMNGVLKPNDELWGICPIPIVTLNFENNADWTYENFRQSWASNPLDPAVQVPICFYRPKGGQNALPDNTTVTVRGQGTTSKGYTIKNIDIDFGTDKLFWARDDWFPEQVYTLKADIVDSAHANNTCIGNFVNTCAQNTNLLAPTPPMQYFSTNKNSSEFELPISAVDDTTGIKVKHTLEGFPVLLLARFLTNAGTTINVSLGIYSFNLGRSSYYNMGFQILKRFRDLDGSVLSDSEIAPKLLNAPDTSQDVIDFSAQSWEGVDSFNCTPKSNTTEDEINAASNNNYDASVNAKMPVQLDGYFWSSYPDHIRHFWESKYGNGDIRDFQELCLYLVTCPYSKGSTEIGMGGTVYQYNWNGTKMYVPNQSSNAAAIQRLNMSLPFNVLNARFYYVTSMLFGLVDSLGKNLNMRIWKNTHINNVSPSWFTCFYDMDTAMGIDNAGAQIVRPDVLDEELINNPELVRKFASGTYSNEKMYTVRDNKLWGILDNSEFKDQYVGNANEGRYSVYASTWNYIRTNFIRSADDFMDKYFNNQTKGVGELMYNQDFDVKYVSTPQFHFMYGDRKAFVRDWITKRIKFLDSYFGYLQQNSSEPYLTNPNIEDCSFKNKVNIKHNSGITYVPVVTNAPCIVTTTIGGQSGKPNSYYVPANTATDIRMAVSEGTPGIQTEINNSDLLLEIRKLPELNVQTMQATETRSIDTNGVQVDDLYAKQYGSLSSFTKFNLSGNKAFVDNAIDFIELFKTWNRGDDTLPYTLTEIDLSNTQNSNVTQFQLNLTSAQTGVNGAGYYKNPFENLTDINIINSCVTGVTLPEDIALNTLRIAGSAIRNVKLNGQSILKTVDFTNCIALTNIELTNCAAFENLTLSGTPQLKKIVVDNCPALNEINIDMNGYDIPIQILVSNTPGLKKVTLKNVRNTDAVVSINASNLETVSLRGCDFPEIILGSGCYNTLKSFDISDSTVVKINWDGTFTGDYLDLSQCPHLVEGGINIRNNAAISKVQLPNNEENGPVNLNFEFTGCTNLTRIYGYINVNKAAAFMDCKKFTIHGGTFNGRSVKEGNKLFYLADEAIPNEALQDVFQRGPEVTNLVINISSATEIFRNTAVDTFDMYYALRHLGPNVRSISGMFRQCPNIRTNIVNGTIDNSPHWTMFDKSALDDQGVCQITNVSYLFYNCMNMGPFRVYGNHEGESDESWAHQGLFTPLVKCNNFTFVFGRDSHGCHEFITDRNVFKLRDGVYFGGPDATVSFSHFKPRDVYSNVNKMDNALAYKAYNSPTDGELSTYDRGNLKGIFSGFAHLPSSLSYVFNSLRRMQFGTNTDAEFSDTFDKLPLEVVSLEQCFNATSTSGNISLRRLFTKDPNDDNYKVTSIISSFKGSSGATWILDNNTLQGFVRLNTFSDVFSEVNKQVTGTEFPYDIFEPCANVITNVNGFFSHFAANSALPVLDIPGRLFLKCTKLKNVSQCFSYFGQPFNPTANGFKNCPELSNVSGLFDYTTSSLSCIPQNFFNTGFINTTEVITGAGVETQEIIIPDNPERSDWAGNEYELIVVDGNRRSLKRYRNVKVLGNVITCNPTSTVMEQISVDEGSGYMIESTSDYLPVMEHDTWNPTVISFIKRTPRRSISSMGSPFTNARFPRYSNTITAENMINYTEDNPDYCPFNYIYQDGVWRETTKDLRQYTFMWAFDGVWTPELKQMDIDGDLDNYVLPDGDKGNRPETVKNANTTQTMQYHFPPDLLRWCTARPDIGGLFSYSGYSGRICPYLLKSVPNLTSVSSLFSHCGNISAYSTPQNPRIYITLPPNFFDYTPNVTDLSSMFANTTFFTNPNVFGKLKGALNVESIFYGVTWSGGTQQEPFELSGVFGSNKIQNCKSAFNAYENRNQYVRFTSMFIPTLEDPTSHPPAADETVFYGYRQGYAIHEVNKTCSQDPDKRNYAYYV